MTGLFHDVPIWAAVLISTIIIAVAFWVRDGGIRS